MSNGVSMTGGPVAQCCQPGTRWGGGGERASGVTAAGRLCTHVRPGAVGKKAPRAGPSTDPCHHGHLHRGALLSPGARAWKQTSLLPLFPLSLSQHGFRFHVLCLIHESCPVVFYIGLLIFFFLGF